MDKEKAEKLAREWNDGLGTKQAQEGRFFEGLYIYVMNFVKWLDKKGYKIVKKNG